MSSFSVETKSDGIKEALIKVARVSKTVQGGRKMSFVAYVVVGDGQGRVGFGHGKAGEVPTAIQKALENARKQIIKVAINADGNTLFHPIHAKFGASKIIMMPASKGTGIIAGAAMRAVFEVLGIDNVLAKVIGSPNPINVVRATLEGLNGMRSPELIAEMRGLSVEEIGG